MRLATFNILHGRSLSDGVVDPGRLAEAVRRLDPDVLALQEVDRDQPRSNLADLTAVAAEAMGAVSSRFAPALLGTPGNAWTAAGTDVVPGAAYGVALISRFPALSFEVGMLPRIAFRFPLYVPDQRRVVVVHEEPRTMVTGRFETPDGPLVIVNTHLSYVPGWGRRQLWQIRRRLAGVPGPVVVMGDLNMVGPAASRVTGYRSLARHPTFPMQRPTRQIDHILARGPLGPVLSSDAPDLGLSDHRALVVELGPRGNDH
ncbi:endonuclease/exonuclease/phosphatase family protein [uncultured Friedmanniella sp.]|uniref:endonuclease/exonuclease/phosphatase family protein n=1 Tax=uncultured Friedmanniella sp. TaxID=335381 RepID=UPI0035CB8E20